MTVGRALNKTGRSVTARRCLWGGMLLGISTGLWDLASGVLWGRVAWGAPQGTWSSKLLIRVPDPAPKPRPYKGLLLLKELTHLLGVPCMGSLSLTSLCSGLSTRSGFLGRTWAEDIYSGLMESSLQQDQTSHGKSKGMFCVGAHGLQSPPWLRYVKWRATGWLVREIISLEVIKRHGSK